MNENLKAAVLICEFNPLHFGHERIISEAKRRCGALICIMSGNFVQRGDVAVMDKWSRSEIALKSGADLIIELPLPWAVAGAERFAVGAVALAAALGCADSLFFGSETDDLELLEHIAEYLAGEKYSEEIKQRIKVGNITFAAARESVLLERFGAAAADTLRSPNAILAIEYLKALRVFGSKIKPVAVRRTGARHDENSCGSTDGTTFLSSSQIRQMISSGKNLNKILPEATLKKINTLSDLGAFPASLARLELPILSKLRSMDKEDFSRLPDIGEGLENRIYEASRTAESLESLYSMIKSKRYTHARIRRIILNAFLGLDKTSFKTPPYLRVLGMTALGEQLLHDCSPSLPVVSRYADFKRLPADAFELFCLEAHSDDLWALSVPVPAPCDLDYTRKIVKITDKGL